MSEKCTCLSAIKQDCNQNAIKNSNNRPIFGISYQDKRIAIAASLIILILAKKRSIRKRKIKKIKGLKGMHYEHKKYCQNKVCAANNNMNAERVKSLKCMKSWEPSHAYPLHDNLSKELFLKDSEIYRQCLKMDTDSFYYLFNLLKPIIQRRDTVMRECISAGERLAITLRYLALGETQKKLAKEFKVAQNTISGIIPDVCQALCSVLQESYLKLPSSVEKWREIAQSFGRTWSYPWCIGVLGGKILKITLNSKMDATNKKKDDQQVTMITLVDSNHKFLFVDMEIYGQLHEEGQWDKTLLASLVKNNSVNLPPAVSFGGCNKDFPFVFIAGNPFPSRSYIMKPYPSVGGFVEDAKRAFNYRLLRLQQISDNSYGILLTHFQIFRHPLRVTLERGRDIVMATLCLHNFLMSGSCRQHYSPPELMDIEDSVSGLCYPGQWRECVANYAGISHLNQEFCNDSINAEDVRNTFCHYFSSNP